MNIYQATFQHVGDLLWYEYQCPDQANTQGWAASSGTPIGKNGWDAFIQVIGGENGVMYAVTQNGSIQWYKYTSLGQPNVAAWAYGSGTGIRNGSGTTKYKQAFGGENGVLYALT